MAHDTIHALARPALLRFSKFSFLGMEDARSSSILIFGFSFVFTRRDFSDMNYLGIIGSSRSRRARPYFSTWPVVRVIRPGNDQIAATTLGWTIRHLCPFSYDGVFRGWWFIRHPCHTLELGLTKSALDNSETRLSRQLYNFTRLSRQNTVMPT